jgi:hypothetical protein
MMLGSSGDIDASADQEREQTGEEPAQHGHEHLAKSEPQVDLSANGEVRVPIEFLYPTGFRRERRVVDSLELGQLRRGEEHGSAYDPGTLRSPVV